MARTSMQETDIKSLWAESITTAVYLKNRLSHAVMLTKITPYFALHNKNPSFTTYNHFKKHAIYIS
jgi:hypothetical protein